MMTKTNSLISRAKVNLGLIGGLCAIFLSILISTVASAGIVNVTVNVPIEDEPEYLIRQIARIEAQQQGINRLPVMKKDMRSI
jgi:hypothetical protein